MWKVKVKLGKPVQENLDWCSCCLATTAFGTVLTSQWLGSHLLCTDYSLVRSAFYVGSIDCRVGHAFSDRHHPTTCAGRTSCGRECRRLWHTLHRVGIWRPHDQGLVHVDVRVCADAERTQARHRLSTVPRQAGGLRQFRQHYPVCSHCSVALVFCWTCRRSLWPAGST